MTRSKRMQPIKNLADGREREAGAQVATARKALEDAEKQLVQLRAYRAEYASRVNNGAAADGVRLQNYHAFLGRLTSAIEQQEKTVADALAALESQTDSWRERRIEAASIGRAVDRMATGERRADDKRTQREDDERSIHRVLRSRDPG
jgi:flagellar protein FliJ